MKLTIIVPVFNEEKTIGEVIRSLKKIDLSRLGLKKEIIVVDDGSVDKSSGIISSFDGIKLLRHASNIGKGAAIRTALQNSSGEIVVIQDADLEYYPKEIAKLVKPIVEGRASVVYGSRFKGKILGRRFVVHELGNRILSFATALLFSVRVSDMETGYKAFKRSVLKGLTLKAHGFDFEPEITAKILKKGYKILELPITYRARTFAEGKKISAKDGFVALKTLIKYRLFD